LPQFPQSLSFVISMGMFMGLRPNQGYENRGQLDRSKRISSQAFVSGHGFSRAAELAEKNLALAPGESKANRGLKGCGKRSNRVRKQFPQRLKPIEFSSSYGTTEVVP
jgi:acyl-CoA synthetase (AMP-forming)/AMP-acid ligase II